ncbi:MAG TPA: hypothetical protein VM513_06760 [Kofleriaceae bacterium]|nr:hypothetical protein [Kofleriaceae bacterium]
MALALTACATEEGSGGGATLTIENDSSYTLISIQLSPTTSVTWGPDLLGSQVLEPGDSLELSSIDCDVYDIRVVDDTDAECILDSVDLCLDDSVWTIDDAELALCAF